MELSGLRGLYYSKTPCSYVEYIVFLSGLFFCLMMYFPYAHYLYIYIGIVIFIYILYTYYNIYICVCVVASSYMHEAMVGSRHGVAAMAV